MQAGASLEKQEKYADAAKAYRAALQAHPGDTAATKKIEYATHMDAGQQALKTKKPADAVKSFEAALKIEPNDEAATKALKQARGGR
jgi:tetratricopeptide (TPR) repeat protein